MTREEAISEWTFRSNHIKKWLDEYGEEPSIRNYVELIDMAIEALNCSEIPTGSDLISRRDAIDAVMAEGRRVFTSEYANAERIIYEADAVEALSMLPSAEPKTGAWIIEDAHTEHCSVCGYAFYISALFAVGGNDEPNYCPNCGTRMYKGGEDE